MSCVIAPSADLFEPLAFTIVPRRTFELTPERRPRSLFDFLSEPVYRRKLERVREPEEDLERWDGLS